MPSEFIATDDFIKALLSPERYQQLDPYELITKLPIDSYHHVADIGCGPGYFALPLAKYLAYGKLYALDTDNVKCWKFFESEWRLPNWVILRS